MCIRDRDKKTPLLRSMEALNVQALRIVRAFGDTESQRITTSVGPEQEYFLVDRDTYNPVSYTHLPEIHS